MSEQALFDVTLALPNNRLGEQEKTLLGFEERYKKVHDRIRLLLGAAEVAAWNKKHHAGKLALAAFASDQYPLVIFYGDVGTGKTATAECIANRLVTDSRGEDSILYKLSNRVRGKGMVGEMSSFIAEAFQKITVTAGKTRRSILIIDEGDSLGASRTQQHSHHEDKVAVNTLIQGIDELRRQGGRIVVFLCTNRVGVLDPALQRRAALTEEFRRPDETQRRMLITQDTAGLHLTAAQVESLLASTGPKVGRPGWTYSDFRTRWYPSALARAFPSRPITFEDLKITADELVPAPSME